jgi:hypothetical protein
MAASKGTPSLAEFAASVPDPRKCKWVDTLPEDVRAQLLATDCSANVAAMWLHALGYEEATQQKVANWLRANRDRRSG